MRAESNSVAALSNEVMNRTATRLLGHPAVRRLKTQPHLRYLQRLNIHRADELHWPVVARPDTVGVFGVAAGERVARLLGARNGTMPTTGLLGVAMALELCGNGLVDLYGFSDKAATPNGSRSHGGRWHYWRSMLPGDERVTFESWATLASLQPNGTADSVEMGLSVEDGMSQLATGGCEGRKAGRCRRVFPGDGNAGFDERLLPDFEPLQRVHDSVAEGRFLEDLVRSGAARDQTGYRQLRLGAALSLADVLAVPDTASRARASGPG